jgi:LmbE family N-acetylglucosaminyl deacetylase
MGVIDPKYQNYGVFFEGQFSASHSTNYPNMSTTSSRRHFVQQTATGLGLLSLPGLAWQPREGRQAKKLKILCLGAHPDDPESGCGGVLARFGLGGHDVVVVYLTRGEAGIAGKSHEESASIRTQEAQQACKILGATPVFVGQVDGDTRLNNDAFHSVQELIMVHAPDIVFTHWPIDSHKDHQAASLLAIQTWNNTGAAFELYFFEVCTGIQTMTFSPTDWVDITAVQELKRKAVYCHQSQDPPGIYACGHAAMEEFRGRELGTKAAEAFVHMKGLQQGNSFPW